MEHQAGTDGNKVTRTFQEKFDAHQKDKSEIREERENDRKSTNRTEAIINFHCSLDKKAYNAIWAECIAGRGANEIASASQVILSAVLKDYPLVSKSIILWFDSCVP